MTEDKVTGMQKVIDATDKKVNEMQTSVRARNSKIDHKANLHKSTTDSLAKQIKQLQEKANAHELDINKRMKELEPKQKHWEEEQQGRTSAPQNATPAGSSNNKPHELTVVVGGCARDTPSERIMNFINKWIRQVPSGPQVLEQGRARVQSPYLLSSVGHISISRAHEVLGRQLVQEGCSWQKQVKVGDMQIKPWIGIQKPVEERRRNRKLRALSKVLLDKLPVDNMDKAREPWRVVCWRSATVILQNKRIVTLERDQTTMKWHDGWQDFYTNTGETADEIKKWWCNALRDYHNGCDPTRSASRRATSTSGLGTRTGSPTPTSRSS